MNHKTTFKLAIGLSLVTLISSFFIFLFYNSRYIQVLSVIILVFIPFILEKIFKFYFPEQLLLLYDIFLFASIILGTGFGFYQIRFWDKYLHIFAGYVMSAIGFSIMLNGLNDEDVSQHTLLVTLFSGSFACMLGVLWEIYEFSGDHFFHLNMQRYLGPHGIPYRGQAALFDTMGDLIADVLGGLVFLVLFHYLIKNHKINLNHWRFKKQ